MKLPDFDTLLKLAIIWFSLVITALIGTAVYLELKNDGAKVNKVQLSIPPAPKKK